MSLPYASGVTVDLIGGESNKVTLPVPYRGQLERLIVKQLSGAQDGFRFDLLDRADACQSEQTSSSNLDDETTNLDRDLHKLQATQIVAGSSNLSSQFGMGIPYVNRDEQDENLRQPTRALYLDVVVSGSGVKTFQVSYTVLQNTLL